MTLKAGSQYDTSYAEIEYFSISACINALTQMCINFRFASYCEPALTRSQNLVAQIAYLDHMVRIDDPGPCVDTRSIASQALSWMIQG